MKKVSSKEAIYKIALILPYWGSFPNYFTLWEYSASKNKDIDFLIFTDSPRKSQYKNIIYIQYQFQEIRNKIKNEIGFTPALTNPYKIVDYKPLYGCIFNEYLNDYSHWVYCDSDVIFGDLNSFLTNEKLNLYDRIYQHGHLCIYKNNNDINYRWKTEHNLVSYNYKEVFKVKGVKMFDERGGMWDIWKENQYSQYLNEKEFADILPTKYDFTTNWNKECPMFFHYESGHLYECDKKGNNKKEFAYLHLQKRKMEIQISNYDSFYIKPNLFCNAIDANPTIVTKEKTIHPNKLKRIIHACLNFDEIRFHTKVAFRRFIMYIKGENRHIKYELY